MVSKGFCLCGRLNACISFSFDVSRGNVAISGLGTTQNTCRGYHDIITESQSHVGCFPSHRESAIDICDGFFFQADRGNFVVNSNPAPNLKEPSSLPNEGKIIEISRGNKQERTVGIEMRADGSTVSSSNNKTAFAPITCVE